MLWVLNIFLDEETTTTWIRFSFYLLHYYTFKKFASFLTQSLALLHHTLINAFFFRWTYSVSFSQPRFWSIIAEKSVHFKKSQNLNNYASRTNTIQTPILKPEIFGQKIKATFRAVFRGCCIGSTRNLRSRRGIMTVKLIEFNLQKDTAVKTKRRRLITIQRQVWRALPLSYREL